MTSFLEECQNVIERMPQIVADLPAYIRTREEGIVPLRPNAVQLHYHADRMRRGYGSYDDILKSRQHGISTWKVIEGLILALMVDGWSGGVFVHEKTAGVKLFRIAKLVYDRMDPDFREERPLDEDRRDAIAIGNSTLYVGTAGAKAAGRSETLHWAHCTEVAFWLDPETTVTGIFEAIPRTGHRCQESTPNGRGNYWYQECTDALRGESNAKLYFYPWWWDPNNALPLEEGERIVPDEEELAVMAVAAQGGFLIQPEQLKWRRMKRRDLKDKFFQEQAEDPETCFLMSGAPLFDPNLLRRLYQRAESALILERTPVAGTGERIVWKKPNTTDPFIVAVDVAEGREHGDWSVISTWGIHSEGLMQYSRTKCKVSPKELAALAIDEGNRHHKALIAVEANAMGGEVIRAIDAAGYEGMQYHRIARDGDESSLTGWHTNARTKPLMVGNFVEDVNAGDIVSFDTELWSQAMNVSRDEFGRPQFPRRSHDDIFMAACIANMGKEQAGLYSGGGGVVMASYA